MVYSSLRPEPAASAPTVRSAGVGRKAAGGSEQAATLVPEPLPATREGDDLIARKVADLRHYDVLGIDRIVAICCWGRSGSYFLASLLDGHEDVLTMPFSLGELIYPFWEKHQHLSLRDKLTAYPDFVASMNYDGTFFRGEFAIGEADYHASVAALLAVYANRPSEVLESRATFFRFLVVAYNLAFGHKPKNPWPLIVHQQHIWSNANAQRLAADFPRCRFIHTVRDPISCFDSTVQHFADLNDPKFVAAQYDPAHLRRPRFNYPAWSAMWALAWRDAFHKGLHDRSIIVRFEDLHTDLKATMSRVARWLGLADSHVLLESTFNGKPWVVESSGHTWTGARKEQVRRRARNLSWVDRTLVFAVFQENFAVWKYPYPSQFSFRLLRALCIVLVLLPMQAEFFSDATVIRAVLWPAIRGKKLNVAGRTIWQMLVARVGLRLMIFAELSRRIIVPKKLANPL